MPQERSCKDAGAINKPAISTEAMLFDGLLPADYLNKFNTEEPVSKIGLLDRTAIRADEFDIKLDELQAFSLNVLAICVNKIVSARRLVEVCSRVDKQTTAYTLGRSVISLKRRLQQATGLPILTASHGREGRTYRLAPLSFVQEGLPDTNPMFDRLTAAGRAKFGRQVWSMFLPEWQAIHEKTRTSGALGSDLLMQPGESGDWRLFANCGGVDSSIFFAHAKSDKLLIDRAKDICRQCPVQSQCLESGIELNEYGVWGGKTERERGRKRKSFAQLGIL